MSGAHRKGHWLFRGLKDSSLKILLVLCHEPYRMLLETGLPVLPCPLSSGLNVFTDRTQRPLDSVYQRQNHILARVLPLAQPLLLVWPGDTSPTIYTKRRQGSTEKNLNLGLDCGNSGCLVYLFVLRQVLSYQRLASNWLCS